MKELRRFGQLLVVVAPIVVHSNAVHAFSKKAIPLVPEATGTASNAYAGFSASQTAALDLALRTAVRETGVVSMSAAIATQGELKWAGSFGWADIEGRTLASPSTRYRTGSVAKPITAMAMMRLVDRGLLELDTPLGTSIEGLPENIAPNHAKATRGPCVRHSSLWIDGDLVQRGRIQWPQALCQRRRGSGYFYGRSIAVYTRYQLPLFNMGVRALVTQTGIGRWFGLPTAIANMGF